MCSSDLEWIGRKGIPTTEVHILDEKWRVSCDIYLDDAPHQLRDLPAHRPDRVVCRFVRPWNRETAGTVTIESWANFATFVAASSATDANV